MENYTKDLVEILLNKEEILWLWDILSRFRYCGEFPDILDLVRNEKGLVEIRIKPVILGESND